MQRIAALACAVALAGMLGGCAAKGSGDGNLVDDWAMMSAPKVPEPVVGECFDSAGYKTYDVVSFDMPGKVAPCDGPHQMETVAVGKVPQELAKLDTRPDRDKFASLFPACEQAAAQYLGADWQSGRLYLYLQPPNPAQWRGGLRTYHCDAAAVGPDGDVFVQYDKTFKDAAKPGGPLAAGCFTTAGADKDTVFTTAEAAPCTGPHDLEYAGFVVAPASTPFPDDEKVADKLFGDACEAKMLAYMGMSRTAYNRQADVWSIWWRPSSETGWTAGDHSARCYFMLHGRKLSRSVKGVGDATL